MGDVASDVAAAGQGVVNAALGYMSTKEQSKSLTIRVIALSSRSNIRS